VVDTGNEAVLRAHSGSPAFRRPSINSFAFDCLRRPILADIVKASKMSESGRETGVSSSKRGRQTKGFLPGDDGLVKSAKLNKGIRYPD
jgi:hypothetical protein